jgi:hypothetical protein
MKESFPGVYEYSITKTTLGPPREFALSYLMLPGADGDLVMTNDFTTTYLATEHEAIFFLRSRSLEWRLGHAIANNEYIKAQISKLPKSTKYRHRKFMQDVGVK